MVEIKKEDLQAILDSLIEKENVIVNAHRQMHNNNRTDFEMRITDKAVLKYSILKDLLKNKEKAFHSIIILDNDRNEWHPIAYAISDYDRAAEYLFSQIIGEVYKNIYKI